MGNVVFLNADSDNDQLRLFATPEQFSMVQRRVKASEGLTIRQRQVFELVAQGLATKLIARSLDIAVGTVKVHLAAVYARFGTCNRVALADILEGRQVPRHWVQNDRSGEYAARH